MSNKEKNNLYNSFYSDFSSSFIVFFVALPLCIGIALASNAPVMSGLISGIVGGILVGALSGSQLGVSGPAAGLTVVVSSAIASLGSWDVFLFSLIIAGTIQFFFGFFKLGFLAYFFPVSVVFGMLSGIGILIILKQIPHAIGYNLSFFGEEEFRQLNNENTFTSLLNSFSNLEFFSIAVFILSLFLLIIWEKKLSHAHVFFRTIQGPIFVVLMGILIVFLNNIGVTQFNISSFSLVSLNGDENIFNYNFLHIIDPKFFMQTEVYGVALTIAVVASLETLLCLEATDKLDPQKRISPPNTELKAQGIGNIVCGILGGLPITQVIVRSSANINFGAKTKLSTFLHGVWLLLSIILLTPFLSLIPLASLSAILIIVGYKLSKPSLFKSMYSNGYDQFIPFVVTIFGIITINLLNGILMGLITGLFFSLYVSYKNSFEIKEETMNKEGKKVHYMVLAEEVNFFNKANLMDKLNSLSSESSVIIDFHKNKYISYDIKLLLEDFSVSAKSKGIELKFINK